LIHRVSMMATLSLSF
jgi:hypothetical protein